MNRVNRLLATCALVLSLAGMLAGDFEHSNQVISTNQIDVYQLATWIRDREPLVLVDLREQAARDEFSLPTAHGLTDALAALHTVEKPVKTVVYGYENQRRRLSELPDSENLHFLAHGVHAWMNRIVYPVVYRNASADVLAEFNRNAPLSRYFGGLPRYSNVPVQPTPIAEQLNRAKMSCGF